jgi:hypothetical protein
MAKQKANGGTAPAGTRLGKPDGIDRPALTVKLDLAGRIFSFIRQKWLVETPEELVRQEYVVTLHNEYGFGVDQMDEELHVAGRGSAKARADVVIWRTAQDKADSKAPLIVVECKADNVTIRAADTILAQFHHALHERPDAAENGSRLFFRVGTLRVHGVVSPSVLDVAQVRRRLTESRLSGIGLGGRRRPARQGTYRRVNRHENRAPGLLHVDSHSQPFRQSVDAPFQDAHQVKDGGGVTLQTQTLAGLFHVLRNAGKSALHQLSEWGFGLKVFRPFPRNEHEVPRANLVLNAIAQRPERW